jgi:hypothetical protein
MHDVLVQSIRGKDCSILAIRQHGGLLDGNIYLIGGFNPPEKYESQIGSSSQLTIGENKSHVPNHQPDIIK